MAMLISPTKLPALAELFKNQEFAEAWRKWALSPDTSRFLSLAADLILPPESTDAVRASHPETLTYLVRKETAEGFMLACLKLEDYAISASDKALPEADYGARRPGASKTGQPAKPAQA